MGPRICALILLVAACSSSASAHGERETERFYYDVVGNNVLLSASPDLDPPECFGAAADPALLRQIVATTDDSERPRRGEFVLERVAYPNFGPPCPDGHVCTDRYGFVEGQRVEPWCGTDIFYWLHGFAPEPAPAHTEIPSEPGVTF